MYAIIKTGGKQYRVAPGECVDVELLNAEIGDVVEFKEVLLFSDGQQIHVGKPNIADCLVKGEMIDYTAGPKIHCMKYKKRKRCYKKWGHRQHYSRVKIHGIELASA